VRAADQMRTAVTSDPFLHLGSRTDGLTHRDGAPVVSKNARTVGKVLTNTQRF
jgi:hypothetical protein